MDEENESREAEGANSGANSLQGRDIFFDLAGAGPNMNRGPAGGSWPGAANSAPPAARFNRVPGGSTASSIRGSVSTNNSVAVFGRANRRTLKEIVLDKIIV